MMTVILESALRTSIMASFVWATLWLSRVSHVVAQKIAWCLFLAAAVAMPSLTQQHAFKFSLPVALRSDRATWPLAGAQDSPRVHMIAESTATSVRPVLKAGDAGSNTRQRIAELYFLAPIAYLMICAIFLLRLLLGLIWAFLVWRRARPVSGLTASLVTVRSSDDVSTPYTIGFSIVLPSSFNDWDPAKLRIVLAHERSHIRQADSFLQLLARLHTAIFWFSPAAWWLQKELADLGEAISDHAAISEGPDRCSYAEVLLEFAAMSRRPLAGIAMARSKGINRRMDRILNDTLFRRAFMHGKMHTLVAAAVVSVALLVSTSLVVVRAADNVRGPDGAAGQEAAQPPSTGGPTPAIAASSEAGVANPQIELLTPLTGLDQTAALQAADLIQQRAKDRWASAMPQGINPRARIVNPNSPSQMRVAIEFSVASEGHVSDMVLTHASGQINLDRAAWQALTKMGPVPSLPSRSLRYRITFVYDSRAQEQAKAGPPEAIVDDAQQTVSAPIQSPSYSIAGPSQIYQVGGGVSAPRLIFAPDPEFTDEARREHYQGVCVVAVIVDPQGNTQRPQVVRRLGMGLDQKAIEAVREYKFKPAMLYGKPVAVQVAIEVNFRLY